MRPFLCPTCGYDMDLSPRHHCNKRDSTGKAKEKFRVYTRNGHAIFVHNKYLTR